MQQARPAAGHVTRLRSGDDPGSGSLGSSARHGSHPVRFGVRSSRDFGRARGSRELAGSRCRADRTRSDRSVSPESAVLGQRSRSETRSSDRGLEGWPEEGSARRASRVDACAENGATGRPSSRRASGRLGGETAAASVCGFGCARWSSRSCTVRGNLGWGLHWRRSGDRDADLGSHGGRQSGLRQQRVGSGRAS